MATKTFPIDPQAVPLEWHEAVGVVQEVATRYLAGDSVMARRASDLSVDADGRLAIPHAKVSVFGKGDAATANEAQHVADLRALLKELLPATAVPPALGALLDAPPGTAQIASVAEFSKALGFFERPGRARDLKLVATRQATAREQLVLNEKLAELTRKARHDQPESDHPENPAAAAPLRAVERTRADANEAGWEFPSEAELQPAEQPKKAQKGRRIQMPTVSVAQLKQVGLLVAAIALVIVAGVVAYAAFNAVTSEEGGAQQPTAQSKVASASGGLPASASASATSGKAPATLRPEIERSSRAASAGRDQRASSIRQPAASASRANTAVAPSSSENAAAGSAPPLLLTDDALGLSPLLRVAPRDPAFPRLPTFLATGRVDATLVSFDEIYDAADDKIRPARLLRPQLPDIPPGTPLEALGVFEFVVSMRGTVDRIRLIRSPVDGQYRDIMLMPAAKAWIFQPATKDGLPVRYRMRIHIPQ